MAHNLAKTADGKVAMAFAGEAPWHGLGTKLDGPATSAEAMAAAHLDFTVGVHRMILDNGTEVPGRRAVVREDTGDILSTVGPAWKPVQAAEAFAFLDGLVGEDNLRYHTAGALGLGVRVWMLAKLNDTCRIPGTDDITEQFLLLSNSHAGNEALRCLFTPVRVVCQNTLNQALGRGRRVCNQVNICHTGDLAAKLHEARRVLGLATSFYAAFEERAGRMAARGLAPGEAEAFFDRLVPDPEKEPEARGVTAEARAFRRAAIEMFETAPGNDMPGVRGTVWAAYNAVTYYADHHRIGRTNKAASLSNNLERNWFGWWAGFKGRAWEVAESFAEMPAPAPEAAVSVAVVIPDAASPAPAVA